MAVAKKAATVPVNMMDTFNSLNNAASNTTQPAAHSVQETSVQPAQQSVQTFQPVYSNLSNKNNTVSQNKYDKLITVDMVESAQTKHESKNAVTPSTEKTMISLRLLKNDKEKFQEFFKSCGLSFTDGLYMAADFIQREVENGHLQMSKSGIQYK